MTILIIFLVQHHCRNCGEVFCSSCCCHKRAIPNIGFTDPVKVCHPCLALLDKETENPGSASSSPSSAHSLSPADTPTSSTSSFPVFHHPPSTSSSSSSSSKAPPPLFPAFAHLHQELHGSAVNGASQWEGGGVRKRAWGVVQKNKKNMYLFLLLLLRKIKGWKTHYLFLLSLHQTKRNETNRKNPDTQASKKKLS